MDISTIFKDFENAVAAQDGEAMERIAMQVMDLPEADQEAFFEKFGA